MKYNRIIPWMIVVLAVVALWVMFEVNQANITESFSGFSK